MRETPLLILAYNRPSKVRALIERLRRQAPPRVMIAVDGPKPNDPVDAAKVAEVHSAVELIDWTAQVEVRFRPVNLGLRRAVVDAVTWAISEHGQAIILEEDVLPGPDFVPYSEFMLDHHRADDRIAHISGYNVVPPAALTNTAGAPNRLTAYPESIAWATWDRAWKWYDDDLTWAMNCSIQELAAITGSTAAAIRWKLNFRDANANRISTWAYRWIGSMWSKGAVSLSPNVNLVTYAGRDEGTHTTLSTPWEELALYDGDRELIFDSTVRHDSGADEWVSRKVFGGTPLGVLKGTAISTILAGRQWKRRLGSARR